MLIVGTWLFPVDWLRFFGRGLHLGGEPETTAEPWIRLIPVESLESSGELVPIRIVTESADHSDVDDIPESERHEWAFDPTQDFQPRADVAEPLAPALSDSVMLRSEFLNALRLANWGAVFAMLDTTQTGRAREQFAETDAWVNHRLGPLWDAQGFARRQANLWNRVVTEAEAEGSH
jgi:hypothetical protein